VSEIVAVEDLAGGPDAMQFTVTDVFRSPGRDLPLEWTGHVPVRAARAFREAGVDVRALLGDAA
jgi:pilus assembly protein CpaF